MNNYSSQHHYNPDWLTDEALVANFIARMDEFTFLRNELARAPFHGDVQHYLLVGLRGSGKTTLLKRLAVAIRKDKDLQDHLIALSFPEELYQVKNLADFWWASCDALVDELDHIKQTKQADQLANQIEQLRAGKPDKDAGLKLLQQTCEKLERRPVLLVDNLDLVFQRIDKKGRKLKDPNAAAYWELREALSTVHSPIVIGGSVRLSEPFTDYDKAFYDFFIPKRLGKLSLKEVKLVLNHLAGQQNVPEVKQRLDEHPARIQSLYELTGGNLRALGLIFELLRHGPNSRAVEDFERLMDITTPYYKARFEDLSEQAQVVMHALAVRQNSKTLRFGHTAAEIAKHAGLPTGSVSAQMEILIREGLAEKSADHGRTQYRIAEQLFRLWLQMRSTRRVRQNVIGLTEFLEAMFDRDEIQAQIDKQGGASPLSEAKYSMAVAGTNHAVSLRKGLNAYTANQILQHVKEEGGEINDYLSAGDLSKGLEESIRLREQLQSCNGGGLNSREQDALLGSLQLNNQQKKASVDTLCKEKTAQEEVVRLQTIFNRERQDLLRFGLKESDLPILFYKRTCGLLPLPFLTPQDIKSAELKEKNKSIFRAMVWRLLGSREYIKFANDKAAQNWLDWGLKYAKQASSTEWANVAGSMRRSQCYKVAKQTLDQAFKIKESSRGWYERSALLHETGGDMLEAEENYRKAIELDPADAFPWNALGILLADKLNRPEESEAAFQKAIELDPAFAYPWYGLGILLTEELNRPEESKAAYRKAIELDPSDALPWNNLGALLAEKPNRPEESEAAYRKAIELDQAFALPWNNLGVLLANELNRPKESEVAYRKAIELDQAFALPWNNLGYLLAYKLNRPEESEAAYRKAIELDPIYALPRYNLARLLDKQNRLDEALTAYKQWAKLDKDPYPYWQKQHANLQIKLCGKAVLKALEAMNSTILRDAFNQLLEDSTDIATSLVSDEFVEGLLKPLLANKKQAQLVLDTMQELAYEKHARPMLLAFEAVIHDREEMLSELEPEIQVATKLMFTRLTE